MPPVPSEVLDTGFAQWVQEQGMILVPTVANFFDGSLFSPAGETWVEEVRAA